MATPTECKSSGFGWIHAEDDPHCKQTCPECNGEGWIGFPPPTKEELKEKENRMIKNDAWKVSMLAGEPELTDRTEYYGDDEGGAYDV